MSLMLTKRASGVLNYNLGTFDNYCMLVFDKITMDMCVSIIVSILHPYFPIAIVTSTNSYSL